MGEFKIRSEYTQGGDQPQAIDKLVKGLEAGQSEISVQSSFKL